MGRKESFLAHDWPQRINSNNQKPVLEYEWIKRGTEGYITTQEQLHLKTYFTRLEARKEGCHLFLPPGNSVGMPQDDWRKILEELQ